MVIKYTKICESPSILGDMGEAMTRISHKNTPLSQCRLNIGDNL